MSNLSMDKFPAIEKVTASASPSKGTRVLPLIQRNAAAAMSSYSGIGSSLWASLDFQ
jgi:hypothetical protein